jgi:hypothetical protein
LFLVPHFSVSLDSVKNKSALIFAEFTVLAESVEADNEFLFGCLKLLSFKSLPVLLFLFPRLSCSKLGFFGGGLFFIVKISLLLLLL